MKDKLLALFILMSNVLICQNHIDNGSFEKLNDLQIPNEWKIISPTVDIIKSGSRVFEKNLSDEYNLLYSDYLPKSGSFGENYICLFKLGKGTEAIGIELNNNLIKGQSYLLKMDVFKPMIPGKYPAFEMGVVLGEKMPKSCNGQQCLKKIEGDLHILRSSDAPILYENEWITISCMFEATGKERFLILAHHKEANKLITDNHILAYLYDNVILERLSPNFLNIFFYEGSSILTKNEVKKIETYSQRFCDKIIIKGYASDVGGKGENDLLARERCNETISILNAIFPNSEIKTEVIGEIADKNKQLAQKVEIEFFDCRHNEAHLIPQKDLLSLIKTLDKLYRKDQYNIEKSIKNLIDDNELFDFQSRQEKQVDSVLNLNFLHSFKLDNRSETNLTTLFLHTKDSIQNANNELFAKAYESGFLLNKNWAYIYDRHAMINSNSQLYGTQLKLVEGKKMLYEIADLENLDKRRLEMGLTPIKEYLNSLGLDAEEELERIGKQNQTKKK